MLHLKVYFLTKSILYWHTTRGHSPLRGLSSSSCGGLRTRPMLFLPFGLPEIYQKLARKLPESYQKVAGTWPESGQKVARKLLKTCQKLVIKLPESCQKAMRKSWDSHETVMWKSWECLLFYSSYTPCRHVRFCLFNETMSQSPSNRVATWPWLAL